MTPTEDAELREQIADRERQCRHLREERDALTMDIHAADEALKRAKCALREARWQDSQEGLRA
jgi:hypothetical protein